MVLSETDRDLYYRLYWHLLFYVSRQLKGLPQPATAPDIARVSAEEWLKLRDGLYDHPELLQSYVEANPERLPPEELAIVQSWRGFVRGEFYIWRFFRKHTLFLSTGTPMRIYGVVALNKPFPLMIQQPLPLMVKAVLLPFKDLIVFDGLFSSYQIQFGSGARAMLNDEYRAARAREGIITTLGARREARPAIRFRYWAGFSPGLPYKLSQLKLVSDTDVVPAKLAAVVAGARRERILDLPARMGLEDGFDPIQVEVLEIELDGGRRRVEVYNRAGSLAYIEDPEDIRRFHRFIYVVEKALPEGRRRL